MSHRRHRKVEKAANEDLQKAMEQTEALRKEALNAKQSAEDACKTNATVRSEAQELRTPGREGRTPDWRAPGNRDAGPFRAFVIPHPAPHDGAERGTPMRSLGGAHLAIIVCAVTHLSVSH